MAIASNECTQVLFVPVRVEQVIVERRLLARPLIERLVHDEESHLVGQVQQLGRWRVVAGADGVASHFGEQLELPLQRADVDRGAKRAEIVVVAYPIQLDVFAVEKESAVWIEPDR